MSGVIPSKIQQLHAVSLDELWREAESLGRIKIDSPTWSRSDPYEVTITFHRRSGTRVHAVGKNTDICFAMADAINEAREMGAGGDA